MRGRIRRIVVAAVVLGLVAQASIAPALAASPGDDPGEPCHRHYGEEAVGFLLGPLDFKDANCQNYLENVKKTRSTIEVQAKSAQDQAELLQTIDQNQLNRTRTNVIGRVNVRTVRLLKNGATRSEAKANVSAMVNETYSTMQLNMRAAFNSSMAQNRYVTVLADNMSLQDYGSYANGVHWWYDADVDQNHMTRPADYNTYNMTLANGTNVSYLGYMATDKNYNRIAPFTSAYNDWDNSSWSGREYDELRAIEHDGNVSMAVDDTENHIVVLQEKPWIKLHESINAQHEWTLNNSRAYVDDMYDQYNAADFDDKSIAELLTVSGYLSLTTNTSGTGSYSARRALTTATGLDASVNSSFTVDYNPAGPFTFRGDRTISSTDLKITVDDPTLGDGAVYAGSERFAISVNTSKNVTDVVLVASNGTTGQESLASGPGDRWSVALANTSFTAASTTGNITASVEVHTENGDVLTVELGDWRYRPTGNVDVRLSGGMFTNWEPAATNGAFVKGETYDTTTTDKVVQFVAQVDAKNTRSIALDGNMTIVELTNTVTGETLTETSTEDTSVDSTFNASVTNDTIDKVRDYISQNEKNYEVAGSGTGASAGSTGLRDDLRNWFDTALTGAWVGLIALAGAGLLMLRILSG